MHSNGRNSMINLDVKNKDMLGKKKKIEKLVKMRNNGKLNKYFEQQMIAHEKNNKKAENESELEEKIENA